jgi:tetratricopeptide (TPR) repeat protein
MFGIFTKKPSFITLGIGAFTRASEPEKSKAPLDRAPIDSPPSLFQGVLKAVRGIVQFAHDIAQKDPAFLAGLRMDAGIAEIEQLEKKRELKGAPKSEIAFAASRELKILTDGLRALEGTDLHARFAPRVHALQSEWWRRAEASLDCTCAKVVSAPVRLVGADGVQVRADNYVEALESIVRPIASANHGLEVNGTVDQVIRAMAGIGDAKGRQGLYMIESAHETLAAIDRLQAGGRSFQAPGDLVLSSLKKDVSRLIDFQTDFEAAFPQQAARRKSKLAERQFADIERLEGFSTRGQFAQTIESLRPFYPNGDLSRPSKALSETNAYELDNEAGLGMHGLGRPREAEAPFLRNLELSEKNSDTYGVRATAMHLAEVYLDLGRFNDARTMAGRAIAAASSIERDVFAHLNAEDLACRGPDAFRRIEQKIGAPLSATAKAALIASSGDVGRLIEGLGSPDPKSSDGKLVAGLHWTRATMEFQRRAGLAETGVVDEVTAEAAAEASVGTNPKNPQAIYAHGLETRMSQFHDAQDYERQSHALLGRALALSGRHEEATAAFDKIDALAPKRPIGDVWGLMHAQHLEGKGDASRAYMLARTIESDLTDRPIPEPHTAARARLIAATARAKSDLAGAVTMLDEAVELLLPTSADRVRAEVLTARGRARLRQEDFGGAKTDLLAARTIADDGGLLVEQVRAREGLAAALVRSDPNAAVESLVEADRLRRSFGYRDHASEAIDHLRAELDELASRRSLFGTGKSVKSARLRLDALAATYW